VFGVLSPFNFPFALTIGMTSAALVADVRTLWTHEDQVARTMEVLHERGLNSPKRVGVNLSSYHLKARYAFELEAALGAAELVPQPPFEMRPDTPATASASAGFG
jgi:hypothetical protein